MSERAADRDDHKENTVLRGKLDPRKVFTIPNAIETKLFYPDPKQFYGNPTTIIFLGRLVCARHPHVRFIVGGDGPKRLELEEMREQYHLHSRVTLLGTLPHDMVREVLVQGQIFINTSLTEAFCMSIVEAASLLVDALSDAIRKRERKQLMDPVQKHRAVSDMYYWPNVAKRTELVYKDAMRQPTPLWRRGLKKYADQGIGFGILYIIVSLINMLFLKLLEFFDPSAMTEREMHRLGRMKPRKWQLHTRLGRSPAETGRAHDREVVTAGQRRRESMRVSKTE
ncbi:glycosyltransferase, group 1 family protein, partial [Teladorsagia circumcincta]